MSFENYNQPLCQVADQDRQHTDDKLGSNSVHCSTSYYRIEFGVVDNKECNHVQIYVIHN